MYLHELLPVVISCVVSKQLCQGAKENHWALRTYASRVLSLISRNFTTTTTMLQYRIVKSLSKPLENQDAAFPQIYGSIVGLAELGSEVIRRTILPKLRRISEKIEAVQVGGFLVKILLMKYFRKTQENHQPTHNMLESSM